MTSDILAEFEKEFEQNFPPPTYDIVEGMAQMDAMAEEAAANNDPTTQNYFLRLDKKTVVKSETEYNACVTDGIPMKIVPYSYACHALKQEEAAHRNKIKARKKQKRARASRKQNR